MKPKFYRDYTPDEQNHIAELMRQQAGSVEPVEKWVEGLLLLNLRLYNRLNFGANEMAEVQETLKTL